jgi:hypothetical protein
MIVLSIRTGHSRVPFGYPRPKSSESRCEPPNHRSQGANTLQGLGFPHTRQPAQNPTQIVRRRRDPKTLGHVLQATKMASSRPTRLADVRERPLDYFAAPTLHRLALRPPHSPPVV